MAYHQRYRALLKTFALFIMQHQAFVDDLECVMCTYTHIVSVVHTMMSLIVAG